MSTNESWISGWGVVRLTPWHFAGLFQTAEPAESKAVEMGAGYVVKYGEQRVGSDEFEFNGAPHAQGQR